MRRFFLILTVLPHSFCHSKTQPLPKNDTNQPIHTQIRRYHSDTNKPAHVLVLDASGPIAVFSVIKNSKPFVIPKTGGQDGLPTSHSPVVLKTTGASVYNNNDKYL